MLASITPLGERSRRQQWGVTVAALAVGGAAGGAAVGAAAATLGRVARLTAGERLLGFAAVTVLVTAIELTGRIRLSPHRRQVNEDWLRRYRGWVYGVGFGAQLGSGLATTVTTSAVYAMLAACLLAPSIASGCLVGLAFGSARGLAPLLTARVRTPRRLAVFHQRLAALDHPTRIATLAAQVGVALAAIAFVA